MKRIIAHFVFGFSVSGSLVKIEYLPIVAVLSLLIDALAEALQSWWNETRLSYRTNLFQWSDVIKNVIGSAAAIIINQFFPIPFWIPFSLLLATLTYAGYCIVKNKSI